MAGLVALDLFDQKRAGAEFGVTCLQGFLVRAECPAEDLISASA
jgi:hypothetical protein